MSLALHGVLFAGLSLWSFTTFGGERVVRTARLEVAEARDLSPAVEPEPVHEPVLEPDPLVDPGADAAPPDLVPIDPVLPDEPPDARASPLEDLAALEPARLPLQPLVRPAHDDEVEPPATPRAADAAPDELASASVEPAEPAGQDEEREPVLIDAPAPRYPPIALRRGWQGTVVLRLWVAAEGGVADVAVEESSGFAIFDDAALEAVRRWRFDAGRLRTVEVLHRVRFEIVPD